MGVGGQHHAPATLRPGKTQYPLYRRLGGPQGWSGQVRKISPPPGFDPRTVQPVASRYTDYAIPALKIPMIPSGIEPTSFHLVKQCLNQLHHRAPWQIVSNVNINPRLDSTGTLIMIIQANKFTQYTYMLQDSLAHHQEALQFVQNDHLIHWCLVCRTAINSSMQNIYWREYTVSWSSK